MPQAWHDRTMTTDAERETHDPAPEQRDEATAATSTATTQDRDSGEWYVARMDEVDALPGSAETRARSYALLDLTPGDTVVDVGCCSGRAVAELDALGCRAIGIDLLARALEIAADRHPEGDFRIGSVFDLPLADGEAAGYRADKLYHLIPDQQAALAEARRVLAPGGRIVLTGPEWDAVTVDADDLPLTRRIIHGRADQFPDLLFTRRARRHLLDAGFDDVAVDVQTSVITTPAALPILRTFAHIATVHDTVTTDEAEVWLAEQEKRAAEDRLLLAIPVWMVSGRRGSLAS
jgi:SAM-dependent methyltransferase